MRYAIYITEEFLIDTVRRYRRTHRFRWLLHALRIAVPLPFAALSVAAAREGAWPLAVVLALLVAVLFLSSSIDDWRIRRAFRRSPFRHERATVRLTTGGVHACDGLSDSRLHWFAFTRAAEFEDGLLIINAPGILRWLPNRALLEDDNTPVRDLVRSRIREYRVIEPLGPVPERRFFILTSPPDHWGDYGMLLTHGMTEHRGRTDDGALQLERTGPFVPPISFPGAGDIVVTDEFRRQLEGSPLKGISFRRLEKRHIANVEWFDGTQTTEEPPEYPETGEPEDYILEASHDEALAERLGDLWELCLKTVCRTDRPRGSIRLRTEGWDGSDLFRADGVGYVYATPVARKWLEETVPAWVQFDGCAWTEA